MSDIVDWTELGIFPLQHHDPSFTVAGRRRLSGVRVHPVEGTNFLPGDKTYGDISGGLFWRSAGGKREYLHTWFMTGAGVIAISGAGGDGEVEDLTKTKTRPPGQNPLGLGLAPEAIGINSGPNGVIEVTPEGKVIGDGGSGGGALWLPIRGSGGGPDVRFEPKAPSLPLAFKGLLPRGHTGIVTAGTEEFKQHETVHPDWLGYIVAVNKAGNPAAGTHVCDLEKDGSPGRSALLQSIFSVQSIGGKNVIGLQLGKGGRIDGKDGYLLLVDHDAKSIGWACSSHGGPLVVPKNCRHKKGEDDDKNTITVAHLSCSTTNFIGGLGDGPLFFEGEYEPEEDDSGHITRSYIRWDGRRGVWRVQGTSPAFYIPPDPPPLHKPDPPPYPPEDVPQPPPKPPRPETGGDIIISDQTPKPPLIVGEGGEYLPGADGSGGGQNTTGNGGDYDPSDPSAPDDILDEISDPHAPDDILDEIGFGPETGTEVGTGVNFVGGGGKPVTPTSSNCISVPNVLFKASATAVGQPSLKGAVPGSASAEAQTAWDNAPQTATLEAFGKGTGQWDGFQNYQYNNANGPAMAPGGVALLPPDAHMHEVVNGTATTRAAAVMAIPPGLSKIGFGTPNLATGGIKSGVVLEGTAAGALSASTVDSGGNVTGTVDLVAAAGATANDVTEPTNLPGTGLVEFWSNSSFQSVKYTRKGKGISVSARMVCTGDPGASGAFTCSFHADTGWQVSDEAMGVDWTNADARSVPIGQGMAVDASANAFYPVVVIYTSDGGSANNGAFHVVNGSPMTAVDASTNPFNWTTDDVLILNFTVTLL